jgi:hypothetical protein
MRSKEMQTILSTEFPHPDAESMPEAPTSRPHRALYLFGHYTRKLLALEPHTFVFSNFSPIDLEFAIWRQLPGWRGNHLVQ